MKSKMDRNYAAASEDALLNSGSILDFIEDKASGFYSLLDRTAWEFCLGYLPGNGEWHRMVNVKCKMVSRSMWATSVF